MYWLNNVLFLVIVLVHQNLAVVINVYLNFNHNLKVMLFTRMYVFKLKCGNDQCIIVMI